MFGVHVPSGEVTPQHCPQPGTNWSCVVELVTELCAVIP